MLSNDTYKAATPIHYFILPNEVFEIGFNQGFPPVYNSQIFPYAFASAFVLCIRCQAVTGCQNTTGRILQINSFFQKLLGQSSLQLSNCQHKRVTKQAQETNAAVSQFIEKISPLELLLVISNMSQKVSQNFLRRRAKRRVEVFVGEQRFLCSR